MSTNDIPPAVTLYWQEERIKELEAERDQWKEAANHYDNKLGYALAECDQLRTLLTACQKALKEMQAERDKAREGKR